MPWTVSRQAGFLCSQDTNIQPHHCNNVVSAQGLSPCIISTVLMMLLSILTPCSRWQQHPCTQASSFTSRRFFPQSSNISVELQMNRCCETQLQRTPVHSSLSLKEQGAEKVYTTKPRNAGGCIFFLKLPAPSTSQGHLLLLQRS